MAWYGNFSNKNGLLFGLMSKTFIIAMMLFSLSACDRSLYQDDSGEFHGTGVKNYKYDSGVTKRSDEYVNGRLVKSTWYTPSSVIVSQTKWDSNGSGFDYYLNEKGRIISKAEVVGYLLHGSRWYFDSQGNIDRVVQYDGGVEQGLTLMP